MLSFQSKSDENPTRTQAGESSAKHTLIANSRKKIRIKTLSMLWTILSIDGLRLLKLNIVATLTTMHRAMNAEK